MLRARLQRLQDRVDVWDLEHARGLAAYGKMHCQTRHIGVNRYLLVEELKEAARLSPATSDQALRGTWVEELLQTLANPEVVQVMLPGYEDKNAVAATVARITTQVSVERRPPFTAVVDRRVKTCIFMGDWPLYEWSMASRRVKARPLPHFDAGALIALWLRLLGHSETPARPAADAGEEIIAAASPALVSMFVLHRDLQCLQDRVSDASARRLRLAGEVSELHRMTRHIGINRTVLMTEIAGRRRLPGPQNWTADDQHHLVQTVRGTWVDHFLLTVADPEVTKVFLWGAAETERDLLAAAVSIGNMQLVSMRWHPARSSVKDTRVRGPHRVVLLTSRYPPGPAFLGPTSRAVEAQPLPKIRPFATCGGLQEYWLSLLEAQVPAPVAAPPDAAHLREKRALCEAATPEDAFLLMLHEELQLLQSEVEQGDAAQLRLRGQLEDLRKLTARPGVDREALKAEVEVPCRTFISGWWSQVEAAEQLSGSWVEDFLLAVADPTVTEVYLWGDADLERHRLTESVVDICSQVARFHDGSDRGRPLPPDARLVVFSSRQRPDPSWEGPTTPFFEVTPLPGCTAFAYPTGIQKHWNSLLGGSEDALHCGTSNNT